MASMRWIPCSPIRHSGWSTVKRLPKAFEFMILAHFIQEIPACEEEAGNVGKPEGIKEMKEKKKGAREIVNQGEVQGHSPPYSLLYEVNTSSKLQARRCLVLKDFTWRSNNSHLGPWKNQFHHLTVRQTTGGSNGFLKMYDPGKVVI